MKNKIRDKGIRILKTASVQVSRDILKRNNTAYKHITSPQSLLNYERSWNVFSAWANEQGIKTIKKIDKELIERFIKEKAETGGRDGKGASAKTLKSYLGAINKVMYASNVWERNTGAQLQKMESVQIKSNKISGVYKDLTGKEWIERNNKAFEKYTPLINTIQGFGLRDRELKTLNTKSFIIDNKGKIFVQTIGKGGKYRISESTKELNDEMVTRYKDVAIRVDDIKNFKMDKDRLMTYMKNEKEHIDIQGTKNTNIPRHIFRSEYANQLIKEKITEYANTLDENAKKRGYSTIKKDENMNNTYTQMGIYKGAVEAFRDVSRNLGHNRLDVLIKYLY